MTRVQFAGSTFILPSILCDIMLEMHQNGELIEELKKIGIRSALLDQPKEKT